MQKHMVDKQKNQLKKIKSSNQVQSAQSKIEFGFFRFHTQYEELNVNTGNSRRLGL
jgi:hypothetical protein